MNLRWQGSKAVAILNSLNGTVSLQTGAGTIKNLALTHSIAELSGIPDLEQIRFDNGTVQAEVRNGRTTIKSARFGGEMFKLAAQGTVDLRTEDLRLNTKLSVSPVLAQKSSLSKIGSWFGLFGSSREPSSDTSGQFVSIPSFWLNGKLRSPRIDFSPKTNAVAATAQAPSF
jgi:hypothetical protein